ncbi:TERF1-interacting nuclear factor 2 isoform X2 [Elgaria multicarinata webbii]|uniref:TERF1-interacting nuclear factor 2 isoform X2 n=1 Tax=Elgaria multicarinata webbii TaxID=159646 RepID=UPI002FCD38A8
MAAMVVEEEEEEEEEVAKAQAPDPCVALRLVAAAAWHVVRERQVHNFPRVLVLLEAVAEAAPNLVHFRHLIKLRLGLQAKIIMKMLQEQQPHWKIYDAIDSYFPEREPPPHPKATAQDLKLVQAAQDNFRDLVLGLLSDPTHLKNYVQDHLENDYGEAFLHVVEELFYDYLWQLESTLPEPCFQQLLEAACLQGPSQTPQPDSSILSRYLTAMGHRVAGLPAHPPYSSCSSPPLHMEEQEEGPRTPEPCKMRSSPAGARRARSRPPCAREEDPVRPHAGNQETGEAGDVVLDSSSEGGSSPFKKVC